VSEGIRKPIRGTCDGGCATAASGAASRLRMSVTMHPTAWHHMVVSLRWAYAGSLLAMAAEQRFNRTISLEKSL
jgi:hypothetical protein